MKKIYAFLMVLVVLVFANSVFGKNVKTEIDSKKGGLVVYEQTAFYSLPDYLLNKTLDSSEILKIIKKGQGAIIIEIIEEKDWKWGIPLEITNKKIGLFAIYSDESWSVNKKEFSSEKSRMGWVLTIFYFVALGCLFIISLFHQIGKKDESKKKLIWFYILLFLELVLIGLIMPNIVRLFDSSAVPIILSLSLVTLAFAFLITCCYLGQAIDDYNSNLFLPPISFIATFLPVVITFNVYNTGQMPFFIIKMAISFILVNLAAYVAYYFYFKKK